MHNKSFRILSCMVLVIGVLLGLAGCGGMPSKSIQTEETIVPDVDDTMPFYGQVCTDIGGDGKGQKCGVSVHTDPDQRGCAGMPLVLYNLFSFL